MWGRPGRPFTDESHVFQKPRADRHLYAFGLAGDPCGGPPARGVNITYKLPLQRRRGDGPAGQLPGKVHMSGCRRSPGSLPPRAFAASPSWTDEVGKYPVGSEFPPRRPAIRPPRTSSMTVQRELREVVRRHDPVSTTRPALPRSGLSAAKKARHLPRSGTSASSSTRLSARACGDCSEQVALHRPWCRSRPSSGAKPRESTNRAATKDNFSCLRASGPGAFVTIHGGARHESPPSIKRGPASWPAAPGTGASLRLDQPYSILVTGIGGDRVSSTNRRAPARAHGGRTSRARACLDPRYSTGLRGRRNGAGHEPHSGSPPRPRRCTSVRVADRAARKLLLGCDMVVVGPSPVPRGSRARQRATSAVLNLPCRADRRLCRKWRCRSRGRRSRLRPDSHGGSRQDEGATSSTRPRAGRRRLTGDAHRQQSADARFTPFQRGGSSPLSLAAIEQAIELNGRRRRPRGQAGRLAAWSPRRRTNPRRDSNRMAPAAGRGGGLGRG